MIKAIIFDCFGVLYNDEYQAQVERFPDKLAILRDLRRQGDYGFFTRKQYIEAVAQAVGTDIQTIESIILSAHTIDQFVLQYITQLKLNYSIGMLSNIGRGWIENFFSQNQLHEFFDAVVLSGDEGIAKPHPRVFELMAERLNAAPEECIMIDDLPENIAGADAAGMKGIVYSNLRDMKIELQGMLDAGTS